MNWKKIHCSGCVNPDKFGGTHCYGNVEHGPAPKTEQVDKRKLSKLTRNNRIHKEGFDAGYKKGYKKGMEDKEKELCQNALNKHNPDYLPSWYTQNKDL